MTDQDKKLLEYAKALLKKAGSAKDKKYRTHELVLFWYDVDVTINHAKKYL